MSLWKSTDANTSAPKFALSQLNATANQSNMDLIYDNTTANVIVPGAKIGVFGVDTTEQNVNGATKGGHAGWVLRKEGTGGRTGRVHIETLVAMGSMTSDGNDDTVYPDA